MAYALGVLRKDALLAAAAMIGRAVPSLTESSHHSTQRRVGVSVGGVPGLRIECLVRGRRRQDEELVLLWNVAGLSSEPGPLHLDPPYTGSPLLRTPIFRRDAESQFVWTRPEDELVADVRRALHEAWTHWTDRATRAFAADPGAWTHACEWVAASDDPARWRASAWDVRGRAVLRAVRVPGDDLAAGGWTLAWLGFADVLDRIVPINHDALSRIRDAARLTRARLAARDAELDLGSDEKH